MLKLASNVTCKILILWHLKMFRIDLTYLVPDLVDIDLPGDVRNMEVIVLQNLN